MNIRFRLGDDWQLEGLLRWLSVGCIALMACTWPLWLGTAEVPRIPWVSVLRGWPDYWTRIPLSVFALLLLANLLLPPRFTECRARRVLGTVALLSWGAVLSFDQLRLQPWAWQFLLVLLIVSLVRLDEIVPAWRWLVISIYLWSGLSKLDRSFVEGTGSLLLEGLVNSVGATTHFWPDQRRHLVVLAMPLGELLIALLLMAHRTRRFGWAGSLLMHAALLLAVGPWGLDHEPAVLVWNLFFIVQNTLLFLPLGHHSAEGRAGETSSTARARPSLGFRMLVMLFLFLPMLEPVGLYDHWPAWAVYCARPEQVRLSIAPGVVGCLPPSLQAHVRPAQPLEEWQTVSLEGWVFAEIHCPAYPQGRYRLALMRAVLQRFAVQDGEFRIEYGSTPQRWTGERETRRMDNLIELDRELGHFWINTSE